MENLNFDSMNPDAIENYSYLDDIKDALKVITGVALVGVRQYVSSGDGKVANRTIRVGESLRNAKMKDLTSLLRLSLSCTDPDSSFYINTARSKDWLFLTRVHANIESLKAPDFTQFFGSDGIVNSLLWSAWSELIYSLLYPNKKMSDGQRMAYAEVTAKADGDDMKGKGERVICTGLYQSVDLPNQFYLRGFQHSEKIISPAIFTKRSKKQNLTKAKNAIKYGLDLRTNSYRSLKLRVDSTMFSVMGKQITIVQTAERIREVIATNEAKEVDHQANLKAKETATIK